MLFHSTFIHLEAQENQWRDETELNVNTYHERGGAQDTIANLSKYNGIRVNGTSRWRHCTSNLKVIHT